MATTKTDWTKVLNEAADEFAASSGVHRDTARAAARLLAADAFEAMGLVDALTACRYRAAVRAEYMSP